MAFLSDNKRRRRVLLWSILPVLAVLAVCVVYLGRCYHSYGTNPINTTPAFPLRSCLQIQSPFGSVKTGSRTAP